MKNIKTIILASLMLLSFQNRSHAVIGGGLPYIFSSTYSYYTYGAMSDLAIAGLGMSVGGVIVAEYSDEATGFMLVLMGLVIMDEETQTLKFNTLSDKLAQDKGVNLEDAAIYNSEIEEVNIIFNEVTSQLTKDSTVEDSKKLWSEHQDMLSVETIKVLKTISSK